jgi:hypothetical protein
VYWKFYSGRIPDVTIPRLDWNAEHVEEEEISRDRKI